MAIDDEELIQGMCCGCAMCVKVCPVGAILMVEDEHGFLYPSIQKETCISCRTCINTCSFKTNDASKTTGPFFAAADDSTCNGSSSGGVFSSISNEFLLGGGTVYGAAYIKEDGILGVRHIRATKVEDVKRAFGSKYTQSDLSKCYTQIADDLESGKNALFSGTPCQVAAIRAYLSARHIISDKLYTMEVICHGVPSQTLFKKWLCSVNKENDADVIDLQFRCKRHGWGHSLLLLLLLKSHANELEPNQELLVPSSESCYYDMFLNLKTIRESCYRCPFACERRVADVTIGDFWGIKETHSEFIQNNIFNIENGVSCLLINNEKGHELIDAFGVNLTKESVSFVDIAKHNNNLISASDRPADRQFYLDLIRMANWEAIEGAWKKRERGVRYRLRRTIGGLLPPTLKSSIKKLFRV